MEIGYYIYNYRNPRSVSGRQMGTFFLLCFSFFFFKLLFIDFRPRRREGERRKHQCVVASCMPPTKELTWPTTQACALTWNQTGDPLVCRPVLNLLSHTSQVRNFPLGKIFIKHFNLCHVFLRLALIWTCGHAYKCYN